MTQVGPDIEVLEFAISREIEARNFYLALAEVVSYPHIAQTLRELADEELEHKAKLEMEFFKTGISIDTTAKDKLLNISDYVLTNAPVIDIDYLDMLEICIKKEDSAFRFYISLLSHVHSQNARETLLGIIEEEIKHKFRFETEYENLMRQS